MSIVTRDALKKYFKNNIVLTIYKDCNKILVMVEPSINKLRSEFAYYGIEVEVV